MKSNIFTIICITILLVIPLTLFSQTEINVGNVEPGELDFKGFSLKKDAEVTISGSAVFFDDWSDGNGFYGWILNSKTREVVWHLLKNSKQRKNLRRERVFDFEEKIDLPKGDYEVYYTGIYSGGGNINDFGDLIRNIFNFDQDELDNRDRRRLKMMVSAPKSILTEKDGKEIVNQMTEKAVVSIVRVRDDDNFKQGFSLKDDTKIRIYALAEGRDGTIYDNAWIYNVKTNRKVWDINQDNASHAGGGEKNILVDEEITLPSGSYEVRYVTDNAHSFYEWNVLPPDDPQFWGITIWAASEDDLDNVIPFQEVDVVEPIVDLTRIRDDELVSQGISLDRSMDLRVLCLGEGTDDLVDYGWIIDADTKEIVWEMRRRRTEHAGGAEKNRIFDETLSFDKGNYIIYYITDDSHSYRDWNSTHPFDQERWGITIWCENENDRDDVEFFEERDFRSENIIAEILKVRDDEYKKESFSLKKETEIRIISIGEGTRSGMVDFGWIENDETGRTVWEMKYRRTNHAGGAEKNRIFNDTIFLEKGDYVVYFETDDSHSYRNWNSTPPRDEEQYGITILKQ